MNAAASSAHASAPAPLHAPEAAATQIEPAERRRAIALDRTLQRNYLLGVAAISVVIVLLAAGQLVRLGFIEIMFAVTAPWVLSRGDRLQDATLRAQMGVSRAAHVLARTRLALIVQVLLIVTAAVVILIGPQYSDSESMRRLVQVGGVGLWVPTSAFAVDLALWVPGILWSHVWCGRDALRRIGGGWTSAVGAFAGSYLLMVVVAAVAGVSVELMLGGGGVDALNAAQWMVPVVVGVIATVISGIVLRWRARVWARTA